MKREYSFDFLKGVAVITMIITHVVAFFHDFSDPVLHLFSTLGATVSFTAFVFASGAVLPYSLFKDKVISKEKKNLYLVRTVILLVFYYVLGFVAHFNRLTLKPLETIIEILTFDRQASFSEFLLGFVIFGLLTVLLAEFYPRLKRKGLWFLGVGLISYVVGFMLWQTKVTFLPDIVKDLLSLFVGQGSRHTFPVLFYMPIFLGGIAWGEFVKNKLSGFALRTKLNISLIIFLLGLFVNFMLVVGGLMLVQDFSKLTEIFWLSNTRFPPSPRFLLIGMLFVFVVFFSYYAVLWLSEKVKLFKLDMEKSPILYLGQNAFQFFFWHTFVLFIISYLVNFNISNSLAGFAFTFLLILLCRVLIEVGGKARSLVKRV